MSERGKVTKYWIKWEKGNDMTLKEVEKLTGVKGANIRFYEREGVITPRRMDNGDRHYSEDDLQNLLRIKLLWRLGVSLDEIKELKNGSKELADVLSKKIEILEKQGNSYTQNLCRAMQEDRVTFTQLDAYRYLDNINLTKEKEGSEYSSGNNKERIKASHPWRRFLARMLDILIYNILWSGVIAFVFQLNLLRRGNIGNLFDTYMAITIMLFLEPLWLYLLKTTPGKAIFGLRIENIDGRRLSYGEGLERTWGVIGAGMGYNLPIYNLIRLWKSYSKSSEKKSQPWDESIAYTLKDRKIYRVALYIGAHIAVFAIFFTMVSAQQLPPNKGNLTVAEFVENYNYYANFLGVDFGNEYLDENGEMGREGIWRNRIY
ncbi:DNA-binding transcriptional MerR regulator [Natranaerovirga pectinivora]|uniref:DNA-binding transcriptional MerR regulator n=1 Tax=Natranaerovirga pectinivora TaxID=682400 RepID=A0A4R3MLN0_9FIRM|nr:MerR family transcriptional regulator [Natranaerovirga pectinivora]TCT15606.1 DNA-binding transcriptional MerR regulator [Natranaerovirga pectinivora]